MNKQFLVFLYGLLHQINVLINFLIVFFQIKLNKLIQFKDYFL